MSHSSLPPELWRRIIQEATSPPGCLITLWNYTPSEKLFRGWEGMNYIDPTIQTKRVIVLVCRQWRSVGIEFLYQWIRFDSPGRVEALLEVFRVSAKEAARGGRAAAACGWWVRRIDIAAFMIESNQLKEFIAFVGLCNHVELVLQIPPLGFIMGDHDLDLTNLLANHFQHSIGYIRLRLPKRLAAPLPVTLTALTALSLAFSSYDDQIIPNWSFPALEFLKLSNIGDSGVPILIRFLERHGTQLTGLHINTHKRLTELPSILSRMTALKSLVFDLSMLVDLNPSAGHTAFPSISHLGIQLFKRRNRVDDQYGVEQVMTFMRMILSWKMLPGLEVVRLLDLEDAASLGTTWSTLSGLCRGENIELSGEE